MNKIINYAGSKQNFIPIINKLIQDKKPNYKNYVEPFLGGGCVFYNLENNSSHKNYLISDLSKNVCNMHNAVKTYEYETYCSIQKYVKNIFGDIKEDKEAYYQFRNYYNHLPTYEYKSLYLILLANSCINSMLRFGPNGMNQSYGKRHQIIKEEVYNNCRGRLKKSSIVNYSYEDVFKLIEEDSVIFLDPPYVDFTMPYSNEFNLNEFINLLDTIPKNCLVMYTDAENELSNTLLEKGYDKIILRTMKNTSPHAHSEKTSKEILYWKLT